MGLQRTWRGHELDPTGAGHAGQASPVPPSAIRRSADGHHHHRVLPSGGGLGKSWHRSVRLPLRGLLVAFPRHLFGDTRGIGAWPPPTSPSQGFQTRPIGHFRRRKLGQCMFFEALALHRHFGWRVHDHMRAPQRQGGPATWLQVGRPELAPAFTVPQSL